MKTTLKCSDCNVEKEFHYPSHLATQTQVRASGYLIPETPCPVCSVPMLPQNVSGPVIKDFSCNGCQKVISWEFQSERDIPYQQDCPCPKKQGMVRLYRSDDAPAMARTGSGKATIDHVIGKSAEVRWTEIHDQQSKRDSVRRAAQQVGLKATSDGGYAPISVEERKTRTRVLDAAITKP